MDKNIIGLSGTACWTSLILLGRTQIEISVAAHKIKINKFELSGHSGVSRVEEKRRMKKVELQTVQINIEENKLFVTSSTYYEMSALYSWRQQSLEW